MNHIPKKPKNKMGRRRWWLWTKDPHCYWCNKKLAWSKTTVDHINQKTKLGSVRPLKGHTVLSCKPCNNQRQVDAFNEMNKVEQWIKTGGIPRLRRAWGTRPTPIYARLWLLYYHLIFNRILMVVL